MRLIQLFQNGQQLPGSGNLNGLSTEGVMLRPPFFEGVTGVTVQPTAVSVSGQPHPQHPQQQASAGSPPRRESIPLATSAPTSPSTYSNATPAYTPMMSRQMPNTPAIQQVPSTSSSTASIPATPQQQQQPLNTTLATQDPYTMTPAEQSRYEALFPQYAKEDNYVYGKEAVELFTKSGLDQPTLRTIWNMVDYPVDNKLSKLEFAIAMHLIVCVSKKNLPMPVVFPPSLKVLKDQEGASSMSVGGVTPMVNSNTDSGGSNVPTNASVSAPQQSFGMGVSGAGGTGGGMSISNAFDNIQLKDRTYTSGSDITPTTAHHSVVEQPNEGEKNMTMMMMQQQHSQQSVYHRQQLQGSSVPPVVMPSFPTSPTNLAIHPSLSTGDASVSSIDELKNLQSVLQKLQAENVSLKAQLGQFSDEETSVRKEITQTISEITALSLELTTLRSQVADAKSSLIEATSELKAQIEKRE